MWKNKTSTTLLHLNHIHLRDKNYTVADSIKLDTEYLKAEWFNWT